MISKNTLLNIFILSFFLGILVNNLLQEFLLSFYLYIFFSLIFINIILIKKNYKKYFFIYIFIFFGFILGSIISSNNLNEIKLNNTYLNKYFTSNYKYEFEVLRLYKKDEVYNSYVVKIDSIGQDNVDKNIYGLVYIKTNFNVHKGYEIASESKIFNIDNIDKFNYKSYLLSKNIYFKSYLYDIKIIDEKINFFTKLDKLRNEILLIIYNIYPKDEAILLSGILIGARENIPKELNEDFNNSGTTHFIAVSGFNITILIIFFGYLFKFFPFFVRVILVISFLLIFCIFVGLEASVVRAGIMGVLGYLISISGRNSVSITLLLLTGLIMLIVNPLYINYDISFHLSFLAVLGILFFKDYFDKLFVFLPNFLSIKDSLTLTFSALSLTLPIIFFNFGQISLVTPLSNIAFAWTIPFIMLLGFISIIIFLINSTFGIFIGLFAYIFLKWDILVVRFFGNLDKFILKIDFGEYGIFLEILYFIIISFFLLFNLKRL